MNKIVAALLSLLVAFGLWLYVITVVAPESDQVYYDVPIRLQGSALLESRGLMLVSDQDMKLDLELHGARTDLNKLSNSNITVIADLSGITTAGEHTLHYSVSYPGSISSGISVVSPEQQTVTVSVMEWANKELPIQVHYVGELPENFSADKKNMVLDHTTVTLSGAREVVDRIAQATIVLDLTDRTTDIDQAYDVVYLDENGQPVELVNVTANVEKVATFLKINMVKTVDVVIEVIANGDLAAEDAFCVPRFDQLVVSGPASVLENFHEIVLRVDITEMEESKVVLADILLPDGVSNESGITQMAVDVTIPAIKTKSLVIPVTEDCFINVPEGMTIEIDTPELVVTFTGREHRLSLVTVDKVRITVDLSGAEAGQEHYAVVVEIIGMENIEVISTYKVNITLVESIPED